jgi:putative transposase
MKKSQFTEEQIIRAMRQAEAGTLAVGVCRKMKASEQNVSRWKRQFAGMAECRAAAARAHRYFSIRPAVSAGRQVDSEP